MSENPETVRCPDCGGWGWTVRQELTAWGVPKRNDCPTCKGTGRVPARHGAAKLDAIVKPVKEA